jgi:hypothetical protein
MITRKDLDSPMFGTGGYDVNGEWNWSGNYYTYFYRGKGYGLKHNYYLQFFRRGRIGKTYGWHSCVRISLTASNSGEISLGDTINTRTLKEAKNRMIKIIEYGEENGDILIDAYKNKNRRPVFIIENNQPTNIGYTYVSYGVDQYTNTTFDYWKDNLINFRKDYFNTPIYSLSKKFNNKPKIDVSKFSGCCYTSGGYPEYDNEELIKKMFTSIKCNPIYKEFVDKIKDQIQ